MLGVLDNVLFNYFSNLTLSRHFEPVEKSSNGTAEISQFDIISKKENNDREK